MFDDKRDWFDFDFNSDPTVRANTANNFVMTIPPRTYGVFGQPSLRIPR